MCFRFFSSRKNTKTQTEFGAKVGGEPLGDIIETHVLFTQYNSMLASFMAALWSSLFDLAAAGSLIL